MRLVAEHFGSSNNRITGVMSIVKSSTDSTVESCHDDDCPDQVVDNECRGPISNTAFRSKQASKVAKYVVKHVKDFVSSEGFQALKVTSDSQTVLELEFSDLKL